MKPFLIRWASTTFAVLIATALVPGIAAEGLDSLIFAGLLLGVLNAVLRPVLLLVALPLVVVSMGLFVLFINAFLLYVVGGWISGFHVAGFWPAFFGGIVVSIASWAANGVLKEPEERVRFEIRHGWNPCQQRAPQPGEMKPVEGRVIEPDTQHESTPRQLP